MMRVVNDCWKIRGGMNLGDKVLKTFPVYESTNMRNRFLIYIYNYMFITYIYIYIYVCICIIIYNMFLYTHTRTFDMNIIVDL